MRKFFPFILITILLVTLASPLAVRAVTAYSGIPTFSIVSVETDKSVTIKTSNFPANDNFTATMGSFGSLGIGGVVVGKTSSGSGGAFTVTYTIPASLVGSNRIAIRLQSPTTGYFAYNWFYNSSTGSVKTPVPGYSGFPTFSIVSVAKDDEVTIKAVNFPTNDTFKVLMGAYGTLGVGGVEVASTKTDGGGSFTATYSIPASLAGSSRIAIRLQSPTSGYFAYNWFFKNTSGDTPSPSPTSVPGYSGFPTFTISAVSRDSTVTIKASNFPPGDSFKVLMGQYGTQGVGGVTVDTTDTGSGGSFTETYSIHASLAGSARIAIRLQSPTSGYFAYNWFFNSTTP